MNRNENTWFGIKLNQRRATNLFILSIAGTLITLVMLVQLFMPLVSMFLSPYYAEELQYYFQIMLMNLPYLVVMIAGFAISVYTLIKCRKIAQSYSEVIFTNTSKSRIATFCSNCGNIRSEEEKFCKQCGQEFS
ncbi:MAG: zinc ribbon domain-containing protein [Candidatus Lokiarchaeota archaeon]|nr:zinc ribbon domain-containing protein [Candidatus Lokiarchaeota archaeon]